MKKRKPVFAGSWYPSEAKACEAEIASFLSTGSRDRDSRKEWNGGIVPHAGWYFSGKIACQVIERLSTGPKPDAVCIFGMHLHEASPNYIMTEGAWETPFGDLPICVDLAADLAREFPFEIETADLYSPDNTIELQLPFVKYFFPEAEIVPMGVAPTSTSLLIGRFAVRRATEKGLRIKVLGSTDLTHYGDNYGFSPHGRGPAAHEWVREENDRRVVDGMAAMDADSVLQEAKRSHNACCAGAVAAAIAAGREMGATRGETVAYATSYEKSPGNSFVGYVGIVF